MEGWKGGRVEGWKGEEWLGTHLVDELVLPVEVCGEARGVNGRVGLVRRAAVVGHRSRRRCDQRRGEGAPKRGGGLLSYKGCKVHGGLKHVRLCARVGDKAGV